MLLVNSPFHSSPATEHVAVRRILTHSQVGCWFENCLCASGEMTRGWPFHEIPCRDPGNTFKIGIQLLKMCKILRVELFSLQSKAVGDFWCHVNGGFLVLWMGWMAQYHCWCWKDKKTQDYLLEMRLLLWGIVFIPSRTSSSTLGWPSLCRSNQFLHFWDFWGWHL